MPATLYNLVTSEAYEIPATALIGRSPESSVQLSDPRASRRHAMVRRHDDGFWFYDLGSFNGSYLNGMRVTTTQRLENGDIIRIADVDLRFETSETVRLGDDSALLSATIPFIQRLPVTVLVSDIMSYTKLSEHLSPDDLAQAIGTWYSDCDQIFAAHGATIDKFIGDAVLAYWPKIDSQTRLQSLRAANALLRSCQRIQQEHHSLLAQAGLSFQSGIAIHLGEVASGRMGSNEFTLVGDAVNVTFRIEGLTRRFNTSVLVSASVLEGWEEGAAYCTSLGEHEVKGRAKPVEIFSVDAFPAD